MYAENILEAYMMDNKVEKKQGTKHSFWQQHIDDWTQSGQSQQSYCQTNGLAVATFGYWRRKLQQHRAEKTSFYPLVLSGQSPKNKMTRASTSSLRVLLGDNRFTIEIDNHFSPEVLREVVTTLEQL